MICTAQKLWHRITAKFTKNSKKMKRPVDVDDAIGASEAVLRIYRENALKDRLVAQGIEDVHNRFNARRVAEEHKVLFGKEIME